VSFLEPSEGPLLSSAKEAYSSGPSAAPRARAFFRVPDFGTGRRRYYQESLDRESGAYAPQEEVTEYRQRQYIRSLNAEQRAVYNLELQRHNEFQRRDRISVAKSYKVRLAAYGIQMPLYRILQDRTFNNAYTLLRIRNYELATGNQLYPMMTVEEAAEHVVLTPNRIYGAFNASAVDELMIYNKYQLLIFLGLRIPTAAGTLGDEYGNPLISDSWGNEDNVMDDVRSLGRYNNNNYTNQVVVPFYANMGVAYYKVRG